MANEPRRQEDVDAEKRLGFPSETRRNVVVTFIAIAAFGPLLWMLLDRDPPYVRRSGQVIATDPLNCGLVGAPNAEGHVVPGGCAEVKWDIRPIRICPRAGEYNVVREIEDSQGRKWTLGPVRGVMGSPDQPAGNGLQRFFALPETVPIGPARYLSTAYFACNPIQRWVPITISEPDILFFIAAPPLTENKRATNL